ncbi:MAG: hypothetical protein A4E55_02437 [Pelotomaculum sp. PtaU1.Bin035]|nr:MAG: hypothetical protein A4E55_02437 [Pelotomaculum sp. PtaU1.Bin035]
MIRRDERIEWQKKLIKDAQDGSEEAFIELQKELRIPVASKIKTRVKNTLDYDDLLKTTWLKIRAEINLYDPEVSTPLTFALKIAEREAKDLYLLGREREIYFDDYKAYLEEDEKAELGNKSMGTDPEASLSKKEIGEQINKFFMHLLELTFKIGGYPNQILAFMYSKVIFPCAQNKYKRASGYPEKVVSDIFNIYLTKLTLELENKYMKYSFLTEEQIAYVFRPMHGEMRKLLKDILDEKTDIYTWNTIKHKGYLDETVGNTIMRHYCRDETDNGYLAGIVTNWCHKVQERVRKYFFSHQELKNFFFSFADNLSLVSSLSFTSKRFRDAYSQTKS